MPVPAEVFKATAKVQPDALRPVPAEVLHFQHHMPILDAGSLRSALEQHLGRRLLWEEWLDARTCWAKYNNAHSVDVAKGAPQDAYRAAEQATREGCDYLLLELV